MANFINKSLEKSTYSLILNSNAKVSGSTNNNAVFNVNWEDFLPREYQKYKVAFNFQTTGGNYKDGTYTSVATVFSSATININFSGRSYSYDATTTSPSVVLGIIMRDIQISTSSSNTLGCYYLYNPPRTISRPNTNQLTVQLYNQSTSKLLVDTNSGGTALLTDCTTWTGIFEFIPIDDDVIKSQGTF